MKQETISGIRTFLAADETVPKDKIESLLRSIRLTMAQHRHLIGARQAMEILGGISRPTLRAYVKNGYISQIGFSSRKVRFDEEEIRNFADNGVSSTSSRPRQVIPPEDGIIGTIGPHRKSFYQARFIPAKPVRLSF